VTTVSTLREVIPEVSRSAHRTIRGQIKVWVRVTVGEDGSVLAATLDRAGSSRYFQRLAIEAAKRWKFAPIAPPSRRLMQVRFDFSRDGTTGHAMALD
jgi:TonB family protein